MVKLLFLNLTLFLRSLARLIQPIRRHALSLSFRGTKIASRRIIAKQIFPTFDSQLNCMYVTVLCSIGTENKDGLRRLGFLYQQSAQPNDVIVQKSTLKVAVTWKSVVEHHPFRLVSGDLSLCHFPLASKR